jgi:hypothetical protein
VSITGRGATFLRSPLRTSGLLGRGMGADFQRDLFFGKQGPRWIEIPYSWLAPTLIFRPDRVVTEARVTGANGDVARATNGSTDLRTVTWELDSACDADAQCLADWLVSTGEAPRMKINALIFNLYDDVDSARLHVLLNIGVGDRVYISDAPADWPVGCNRLWIEGRQRERSNKSDFLRFRTSPMPNRVPGVMDTYITAGGTDPNAIMPF